MYSQAKSSGHAFYAVSCVGEDQEKAAANYSNHGRKTLHHFIHLLNVTGEKAIRHTMIGESNCHENHQ